MRTLYIMATIFVFTIQSCKQAPPPEVKTITIENRLDTQKIALDPNANYTKVEFGIEGMTCEMGCARAIEKKIAKLEGVKSAKVNFNEGIAMVEYDEAKVTPNHLEETVAKVGKVYKVKDLKQVDAFSMK